MDGSRVILRGLWQRMSAEQRSQSALHFWKTDGGAGEAEKMMAIAAIARARGSRELKIRRAPRESLQKWTVAVAQLPEDTVGCLIRLYLLNEQQSMIAEFLDDLRIPHENGVINQGFSLTSHSPHEMTDAARRSESATVLIWLSCISDT